MPSHAPILVNKPSSTLELGLVWPCHEVQALVATGCSYRCHGSSWSLVEPGVGARVNAGLLLLCCCCCVVVVGIALPLLVLLFIVFCM